MNKPKLRFKGYTDEWEEKKLGEAFTMLRSGLSRKLSFDNIGIPVLRANNVEGSFVNLKNLKYWYLEDPQNAKVENYIVDKGDLLINFINSTPKMGTTSIYTKSEDVIYTTNLLRAKISKDYVNTFFLYYSQTNRYKYDILSITKPAVNQASFTTKDFKNIDFYVPSFPEQEKIGSFLSKIDERIELEEKKVELFKERKRGWMQKLFNQEIRFKDENGNDYPDWEEKKLGEIGQTFTGLSGKKKEDFGHGDAKFITFVNVLNNIIADKSGVDSIEIDKKQDEVKFGEILFTTSSETPQEVGMASLWISNEPNIYLNSFCFGYRLEDTVNILPYYLVYALHSSIYRKQFFKLAQGISRYNISKKKVMEICVFIPSLPEQEKIADFLSKQDELISAQEKKVSLLKEQKRGLLQQMFV